MATKRTEPLALVARVRRVGWPVRQTTDGYRVTCPDKTVTTIHLTPSARGGTAVTEQYLVKAGLAAAEEQLDAEEEQRRQERLAADRQANDRRTVEAQRKATALALAAGPYGPAQVTIDEILAEHPAPRVWGLVHVTPPMAEAMQERNSHNRPPSRFEVDSFAAELRAGRLRHTHQGLAFDRLGRLQDGQSRVAAIIETGIGADLMVSAGWPPENFPVIDTGRRRTASQVLAMEGAHSTAATAGALKLLYLYDHGVPGVPLRSWSRERVGNDLIVEVYAELDQLAWEFAFTSASRMRREIRLPLAGLAAGFYLIRARVPDERAERFGNGLALGVEPDGTDPVCILRRQLVRQATGASRKLVGAEQMALIIKGWNAYAKDDRSIKSFVVRADSPMPTVYTGD